MVRALLQDRIDRQRMVLLKRSGLFGSNTRGVVIQRATTLDELRQAYRLVHDTFVETGYILPHQSGLRIRIFEAIPEMATFVAKVGERVVGVLSLLCDSPDLRLPADTVYRIELDELRATGARLCEVTNQAIAPEFRKSSVTTELMRCVMAHALAEGYDEGIVVVSPSHVPFYRLLGFRNVGCIRSYSSEVHDPVGALSVALDQYRNPYWVIDDVDKFIWDFMAGRNPYHEQVRDWNSDAQQRFLVADLLREFFMVEGQLLDRCSQRQIVALLHRWGWPLFDEVIAQHSAPGFDESFCASALVPALAAG